MRQTVLNLYLHHARIFYCTAYEYLLSAEKHSNNSSGPKEATNNRKDGSIHSCSRFRINLKNKVDTWMNSLYFWFETSMAGDSQRMVRLLQNLTKHTHRQKARFFAFKFEHLGTE